MGAKADARTEEAIRLLSEVAAERHAGECVLVRVEMRGRGNERLELLDFAAVNRSASSAVPPSAT